MNGIVGIVRIREEPVRRQQIEQMLGAMPERGRDGISIWCGGGVGLGQTARHRTGKDLWDRWPGDPSGELLVVADARLDDRDEMIGALGLGGSIAPVTDDEILLAAYRRWGEDCAARLLGDFAFAVWDTQRRRLHIARDHCGGKALFYHRARCGSLYFATEVKALLAAAEAPRDLDELQVAYHFAAPVDDGGEGTIYRAVRALPPAHTLTLDAAGLRTRRYWEIDEEYELRLGSDAEYAEAFRERFDAALRGRLRARGPVGVTLSGGLDSSTIASAAARLAPGVVQSYSAVFPHAPSADEREYQRSVVERWGLEHSEWAADADSPLLDHDRVVERIDGWQTASNLRLNWNLYRMAAERGAVVMLEGFDGDNVVSHGTGYFGELAQRGAWLRLALEVGTHARSRRLPVAAAVWSWWSSFGIYPRLQGYGVLNHWLRIERRLRRRAARADSEAHGPPPWRRVLRREFVERITAAARRPMPPSERAHHARTILGSLNSHTTEMLSACGATFGIDVRFPFFDPRLIEFCVSLPPQQKIRRGVTRLILRRGMRGIVPDLVLDRPDKANIEPGFARALRLHDAERVRALLESDALDEIADYVEPSACREFLQRYVRGAETQVDRLVVWQLISFLLWMRGARVAA